MSTAQGAIYFTLCSVCLDQSPTPSSHERMVPSSPPPRDQDQDLRTISGSQVAKRVRKECSGTEGKRSISSRGAGRIGRDLEFL